MRQRSKVWLHFRKIDANNARCNICKKDIPVKTGNTTNLMRHLIVHGIDLRAESSSVFDSKKSGPQPSSSQPVADPGRSDSTSPRPDSSSSESTEDSSVSGISAGAFDPDVMRTRPVSVNPFTLAEKGKLTAEKRDEDHWHRAVTNFVVKSLLPVSTLEAPWWRELIRVLNPMYQSPSRDMLSNTLLPAWYAVEKENVKRELEDVKDVAVTADGWTSVAQDHYLTVSVHFVREDTMNEKILHTRVQNAVISGKTGLACTDEQRRWNAGTAKNLQPKRLSMINFRHHKAEQQYNINSRAADTISLYFHKCYKDLILYRHCKFIVVISFQC
ncbi:zinc finger BED domain-containing protein 6-like [Nematolebias whitei]|uniref:zinc finger BED domain-containing protein 6-like n=1 Tax=Nematolebias whitei TaxID=451745 RepID=UPI001898EC1E|nr:zinc finger BED domain-containing protein 6-like [Nematolebias whitei]